MRGILSACHRIIRISCFVVGSCITEEIVYSSDPDNQPAAELTHTAKALLKIVPSHLARARQIQRWFLSHLAILQEFASVLWAAIMHRMEFLL